MLHCGVDDQLFFNVVWYNRVMFWEMCSVLTVGEVKRVLLQVEECRCGLWHARDWCVCVCVCVCVFRLEKWQKIYDDNP